jgi:hypothetical protein
MPALTQETRHRFTLVLRGLNPDAEDFEDKLFEAGCSDATISVINGIVALDFARSAKNFVHALATAIRDARRAGGEVVRIEPDPYVTAAEIAERAGLTRQAVSYLIQGARGPGNFPAPVFRVTSGSPLYDWLAVARWLRKSGRITGSSTLFEAAVVQEVNKALHAFRPAEMPARRRSLIGVPPSTGPKHTAGPSGR